MSQPGFLSEMRRLLGGRNLIGLLLTLVVLPLLLGPEFGTALLIAMFVHELGHVLALRWLGIGVREMKFMILGAAVTPDRPCDNPAQDAFTALAGPLTGIVVGGLGLLVWQLTGWGFAHTLAFMGIVLNLFNLLPSLMLDGGHVWRVVVEAFWPKRGLLIMLGVSLVVAVVCIWLDQWIIAIVLAIFANMNFAALRLNRRIRAVRPQIMRALPGPWSDDPVALALWLRQQANGPPTMERAKSIYTMRSDLLHVAIDACDDRFACSLLSQQLRHPREDFEDFIGQFLLFPEDHPLKPRLALCVFGAWLSLAALLLLALHHWWPMFF